VTDGYYFARFSIRQADGRTDFRRHVLRRVNGRFSARRTHYRRESCGLTNSYKLLRPVFGGRTKRAVGVSFRVLEPARVTVEVRHRGRTIRTFGPGQRVPGRTHRLRLEAERLPRGDYEFVLTAVAGGRTVRASLVSRVL
jgi:hypothetical protein